MESFLLGVGTAVFGFFAAYKWLSLKGKQRFNRWFANSVTELTVTFGLPVVGTLLTGSSLGGMFAMVGAGVGFTLALNVAVFFYGKGK